MPARVWGRGRCPAGSSCLAPPTAAGSLSHRHGQPAESRLCVEPLRARRAPLSRDALRWPPTPDAGLCFAPETRVRYADSARLRKRRTDRPCLDRMRQLLPYHHRVTRTDHARDSDSGPPLQAPGATDDAFSPPPPPLRLKGRTFPRTGSSLAMARRSASISAARDSACTARSIAICAAAAAAITSSSANSIVGSAAAAAAAAAGSKQ